jgi:hypothetical protein
MLKARGLGFLSRGIRVGIHAPWISHLLFADDSIVFNQANQRSADRLTKILETYRRGSGQLINKQRSAVLFSANCDQDTKETVKSSLQIESEALSEKYLGLPTAVGKVVDGTFDYSADRIRSFVHGWGVNPQAVPTYPMSSFKLPAPVCKKMKSYMWNYWWGAWWTTIKFIGKDGPS